MARVRALNSPAQLAKWRERIKTGKAIEILNKAVEGKIELSTARIRAIEIALRKTW